MYCYEYCGRACNFPEFAQPAIPSAGQVLLQNGQPEVPGDAAHADPAFPSTGQAPLRNGQPGIPVDAAHFDPALAFAGQAPPQNGQLEVPGGAAPPASGPWVERHDLAAAVMLSTPSPDKIGAQAVTPNVDASPFELEFDASGLPVVGSLLTPDLSFEDHAALEEQLMAALEQDGLGTEQPFLYQSLPDTH